jgi:hypothetical protein
MIRINDIKKALASLVGWERPYTLNDDLPWDESSESGVMFQDAHPLMTIDNIRATMPEDYYKQYAEYKADEIHNKGDKCRQGKTVYIAATITDAEPSASEDWSAYDIIRDWLARLQDKGTTQMVQRFLADKKLASETKELLERRTFFDGAGRLNATAQNRGRLVGMEIIPVRSMGVTAKIERIGFQGKGGVGDITFYVFHSSQIDPIYTLTFQYTKTNGTFQWFVPSEPIYLPYISDETDSGGSWFLMYNQNDLPSGLQAINVSKDWSREPCGTCNEGNLQAWRELTKYLQISPFCVQAPTTFKEYPELPDIADLVYTNTSNYGLNVEISVGCDLTDYIISQRRMFAEVLQKQVAYNALRTMAMNPEVRVNRNQSNVSRMDILYELDGNTQGRESGLGAELNKAYEALEIDVDGIDRICLTCNNHGVKYRTI